MPLDSENLRLLRECADNRRSVFFSGSGVDVVFQTHIVGIENEQVKLHNAVPPSYISRLWHSQQFYLQAKMTRFSGARITTDGEHIIFPVESLQIIEETRESQRFPFEPEERVVCELLNPFDRETWISKAVMDMSASGLSIATRHASQLFRRGTHFDHMKVVIDGEPYAVTSGTVMYVRKLLDNQGKLQAQVGFKLDK